MAKKTNWELMSEAHEQEAASVGVEIYNFGWVAGNDHILSKTSDGLLETTINKKGKISHEWAPYFPSMTRKEMSAWMTTALVTVVVMPAGKKFRKLLSQIKECEEQHLEGWRVRKCRAQAEEILDALREAA